MEVELQYTATSEWDVILRLPWERKQQHASFGALDAANPEEQAEMQRNVDLHHRSDTFSGISDLMLLGRHRWSGVWRPGDALRVAAGVTLPTGRTVEDPYLLGDRGIQHSHIQFGTGTLDPLFEASYFTPLRGWFSSGAYLTTRLPIYENARRFRAPSEVSTGISLIHAASDRLRLRAEAGAYAQGYGYWNGERDENTGLVATSVTAGAALRIGLTIVAADLRYPLSQRTLSEGDAFRQGPTVSLTVAAPLRSR